MRLLDSMVLLAVVDVMLLAVFFAVVLLAIRRFQADKQPDDAALVRVEARAEQAEEPC